MATARIDAQANEAAPANALPGRVAAALYGTASYALFLGVFLYTIGFVTNLVVPRSINVGPATPFGVALLVNVLLLALFGIQHSIMARPAFKRWWTTIVPTPIERSTFVLATCAVLVLMFWQWRPIPGVVWQVDNPIGAPVLHALGALGWVIVLASTFNIDHFELFGVKQVLRYLQRQAPPAVAFKATWLYTLCRHPLMLGFLIAFWATPHMTLGHLVFALGTTGYILLALQIEERDLVDAHGDDYRQYQQRVPMLVPGSGRK